MNRRAFLAASITAITAPRAAGAQQPGKVYRVAILARGEPIADLSETSSLRRWRVWHEELRRLGYVEGGNLVIERRSTEGDSRRLPELVREMASLKPDVIFTYRPDWAEALKATAPTIPIVAITGDPVRSGLAASLARPGGNVTGFTIDAGAEVYGKRIALLKEAVPKISRLAVLALRQYWESFIADEYREAARRLGITIIGAPLDAPVNEQAYRRAFAAMVRERADSVSVSPQAENTVHRGLIVELAAPARLPTMCAVREVVEAGGLMAYAVEVADLWRRAAGYIDVILKGADPANLPFQQPTKFELIINLKTAKALDLAIPEAILVRADEVIE